MSSHSEQPEIVYLEKLKKTAQEVQARSIAPLELPESAFAILSDYKTLENLIYQDTLQAYDDLIDRAVASARHSYLAHIAAAKVLYEREVVINNETIAGVISGDIAYLRTQAELHLWSKIVSCPVALTVTSSRDSILTTIPIARFIILHLSDRDLQVDDEEYFLVKKSKNSSELKATDPQPVIFDGKFLIAGSVSAVSKN
ncbi:hypothetical protein FACS189487_11130 [Campylobacterota bacterium]|nr:hypothetical protein FACS189487_11130 [Campylobacterota bacterium]